MPNQLHVVVGGQLGSESKGRVTASLIQRFYQAHPDAAVTCIRVAGPNAGHIVWAIPPNEIQDSDPTAPNQPPMQKFPMRQIPVGFIDPRTRLYIGPGSEINIAVLEEEIHLVENAGFSVRDRLFISPQATILESEHISQETDLVRAIGSTGKGIGAARAARLMRRARIVRDNELLRTLLPETAFVDLHEEINESSKEIVVIEGTQGYGLGLHAGHYPQCTSSDCRAIDFIAMSGVNPWASTLQFDPQVHMVIRPFPIRVAGDSGPLYEETTWEELGLPAEKTTVTQKIRRVGRFDPAMVLDAVRANGDRVVRLHLAMADQLISSMRFMSSPSDLMALPLADRQKLVQFLQSVPFNDRITSLGTGPATQVWVTPDILRLLTTQVSKTGSTNA